jgi:hypothetical protein
MSQFAMPRNNEIGITDQRIPHNPEGGETTELRVFGSLVPSNVSSFDTHPVAARPAACPMSFG